MSGGPAGARQQSIKGWVQKMASVSGQWSSYYAWVEGSMIGIYKTEVQSFQPQLKITSVSVLSYDKQNNIFKFVVTTSAGDDDMEAMTFKFAKVQDFNEWYSVLYNNCYASMNEQALMDKADAVGRFTDLLSSGSKELDLTVGMLRFIKERYPSGGAEIDSFLAMVAEKKRQTKFSDRFKRDTKEQKQEKRWGKLLGLMRETPSVRITSGMGEMGEIEEMLLLDMDYFPACTSLMLDYIKFNEVQNVHQVINLALRNSYGNLCAFKGVEKLVVNKCETFDFSTVYRLSTALTHLEIHSFLVNMSCFLSAMTPKGQLLSSGEVPWQRLRVLDVSHNQIQNFPKALKEIINLEKFIADYNELSVLENLDGLKRLVYFSARNNNLSNVAAIATCPQLTYLDLDNNNISDFPWTYLPHLQKLGLSHNNLMSWRDLYLFSTRCEKLKVFDIENDGLKVAIDAADYKNMLRTLFANKDGLIVDGKAISAPDKSVVEMIQEKYESSIFYREFAPNKVTTIGNDSPRSDKDHSGSPLLVQRTLHKKLIVRKKVKRRDGSKSKGSHRTASHGSQTDEHDIHEVHGSEEEEPLRAAEQDIKRQIKTKKHRRVKPGEKCAEWRKTLDEDGAMAAAGIEESATDVLEAADAHDTAYEPKPEPVHTPKHEAKPEPRSRTPTPIHEPQPEPVHTPKHEAKPEPVRSPTPEAKVPTPRHEAKPQPVRSPTPEARVPTPKHEAIPEPVRTPTPEQVAAHTPESKPRVPSPEPRQATPEPVPMPEPLAAKPPTPRPEPEVSKVSSGEGELEVTRERKHHHHVYYRPKPKVKGKSAEAASSSAPSPSVPEDARDASKVEDRLSWSSKEGARAEQAALQPAERHVEIKVHDDWDSGSDEYLMVDEKDARPHELVKGTESDDVPLMSAELQEVMKKLGAPAIGLCQWWAAGLGFIINWYKKYWQSIGKREYANAQKALVVLCHFHLVLIVPFAILFITVPSDDDLTFRTFIAVMMLVSSFFQTIFGIMALFYENIVMLISFNLLTVILAVRYIFNMAYYFNDSKSEALIIPPIVETVYEVIYLGVSIVVAPNFNKLVCYRVGGRPHIVAMYRTLQVYSAAVKVDFLFIALSGVIAMFYYVDTVTGYVITGVALFLSMVIYLNAINWAVREKRQFLLYFSGFASLLFCAQGYMIGYLSDSSSLRSKLEEALHATFLTILAAVIVKIIMFISLWLVVRNFGMGLKESLEIDKRPEVRLWGIFPSVEL
eukprot:TRINITY_DN284_c0_g2_i3.p1 TRINITY_DN284_c0_g2~~TRINITY_DN284_c0_g2_i3.p1  ORF type:complete len:1245 (+),score=368.97 TRINITY_DN284_c0_g2_i3:36-3770(+)